MPPFLRKLQQNWLVQLGIAALIATVSVLIQCAGNGLTNLSFACFRTWVLAAGGYLLAQIQHSPGSASFNPDGSENKQVKEIIAADQAQVPVAVVPVASAAMRENVREAVAAQMPVKIVNAPVAEGGVVSPIPVKPI